MFSKLVKQSLNRSARVLALQARPLPKQFVFPVVQQRSYYQANVLMNREYGDGYMADPIVTAERIIRIIALHDNLAVNPSKITVGSSFDEIGLNELDMCEIYLMIEKEFDFEISEEDCESFTCVNDIVEFTARNFYAKWKNKQSI